jgi:hypothetical protein
METEWINKLNARREADKAGAAERAEALLDKDAILYLCGPMTGHPEFNYPAFNAAAARLRAMGLKVRNPAERFGGDTSRPLENYLWNDFREILYSDCIAVLPGWRMSPNGRKEVMLATSIGLAVIDAETLLPIPADESALEVVEVHREEPLIEAAKEAIDRYYGLGSGSGMTGIAMAKLDDAVKDAEQEIALARAKQSGVEAVAHERVMDAAMKEVA